MADIKSWANTAGGNTSSPPDGAPEGMAPSTVNDCIRENMAATRRWYEGAEWIDLGHTPSFVDANTITVSGDQTTQYQVGRGIRITDSGFLYGIITGSSFGGGNTTIDVTLDSGSITSGVTAVSIHILSTNSKIRSGQIADDAITLAKMENGTQGDILYYAAAGAPTRLGAGTDGQVLATNGAAANPAWEWSGVVQQVYSSTTSAITGNTQVPYDDTIPQIGEGFEVLTAAITPKNSSHKLIIEAVIVATSATTALSHIAASIFQDANAGALATVAVTQDDQHPHSLALKFRMTAGTTSATTFKLRVGQDTAANLTVNGKGDGTRIYGGACTSSLTVTEIV